MGQNKEEDSVQEEKEEKVIFLQPEKTQEKDQLSRNAYVKDASEHESNQAASHNKKEVHKSREIPKSDHMALTGGHGGVIPAFIIWLIRKIFSR
jgi:hypothetical protein